MCFTRDMCFPGREHISLGIFVSQVGECISVRICVSQVTGSRNLNVAGDSAGCQPILTTLCMWEGMSGNAVKGRW